LIVSDIEAARKDLLGRGVEVSRVGGPDTEHRSYRSFASFRDPDGNAGYSRRSRRGFPAEGSAWTSRL
jgi:hypothetical protein